MKNSKVFKILLTTVILIAIGALTFVSKNSERNILPEIIELKNDQSPKRTPDVFRENFSDSASKGELHYINKNEFSFKYSKSSTIIQPFTGVFFPLENTDIDFSLYDEIIIGLKSNKARRIPFNLSVQNKKETHQYVRNFIEVKEGKQQYTLYLNEFFTPTSWYQRNDVAQVEIPKQDFSKIEALSFESCQLLKAGIEDEFVINQLVLRKNLSSSYFIIVVIAVVLIAIGWILILQPFKKKTEIVHVPIEPVKIKESEKPIDAILVFLAENYNNPNLTLNDLSSAFSMTNTEISKQLKAQTKLSFPKYLSYLRIEEAKRILKNGSFKTVTEVGYTVGFNSASNFIRVFKTLEGTSPKKYFEQLKTD